MVKGVMVVRGELDMFLSPFSNMKVVQVLDRSKKTYLGPWEWHDESVLVDDYMLLEDAQNDGFSQFDPTNQVPETILPWKLRAELGNRNLIEGIENFIDSLEGSQRIVFAAAWEYVAEPISRKSSFVTAIASGLSLDNDTVDDIFRKAEAIR